MNSVKYYLKLFFLISISLLGSFDWGKDLSAADLALIAQSSSAEYSLPEQSVKKSTEAIAAERKDLILPNPDEVSSSASAQLFNQEDEGTLCPPRGVLIFFDESEQSSPGALTHGLTAAINQNAGPIIASRFLVSKILPLLQSLESSWIVKQIDPYLCLLLPREYLKSLDLPDSLVDLRGQSVISERELQFGMKIDHMPIMQFSEIEAAHTEFTGD